MSQRWSRSLPWMLGGVAAVAVAPACSEETPPAAVRNLDRPSAVEFACYGTHDVDGDEVTEAQPMAGCAEAGEENDPGVYGFILQGSRGTVAVVNAQTQVVLDSDPLTPGKNAIPIGSLPVGLTTDTSGCFMMSVSAATCDLATLDVTTTLNPTENARITRVGIQNSGGSSLKAKARALVGPVTAPPDGERCPANPEGLIYVAYPSCNAVAVIDVTQPDGADPARPQDARIVAGVRFDADGNATIVDGAFSCPAECGEPSTVPDAGLPPDAGPDAAPPPDAGPPPDGGPPPDAGPVPPDAGPANDGPSRPVALATSVDGQRLYIASENSAIITAVDLDANGLPTALSSVQLELPTDTQPGGFGVTALAVSDTVDNAGDLGRPGGGGGESRYLYAVATDRTVRVAKIDLEGEGPYTELGMTECDTQVDPRYLHVETDLSRLSCLPVGDPATPRRRSSAHSPGIHLPGDQIPLDVALTEVVPPPPTAPDGGVLDVPPGPGFMTGTFGFVTSSQGNVFIVNVDDDNYGDFEVVGDPIKVSLPLAMAHQLRDRGNARDAVKNSCSAANTDTGVLGPRVENDPFPIIDIAEIAPEKIPLLPTVRKLECDVDDDENPPIAVSELAFTAPNDVRELAFPDWRSALNEQWSIVWEGFLSRDAIVSDVDGPPVRAGTIDVDGYRVTLSDPASSFCQLGAEKFDAVQLIGCDPAVGGGQCGLDETCFVHPDSPAVVTSGVCLPSARAESLAGPCRDFLISRRQYSVSEVAGDHVVLVPRRRVLRTSPVDGCTSDDQCELMARLDKTLTDPAHPAALGDLEELPETGSDWRCTQDPSRAPGPDRCLMACTASTDCEDGDVCLAGFCNEGAPPGDQCVQAVQRYQVRASDAYVLVGTSTGYLHNWVQDEDGQCVLAENPNPLNVGRIPLRPPECPPDPDDPEEEDNLGEAMEVVSPNPCAVPVDQVESFTPYSLSGEICTPQDVTLRRREGLRALRFQNPALRFHLVDTAIPGDESCIGDRAGDLPPFSAAYPGFEIRLVLTGGFATQTVPFGTFVPTFPVRIAPAPDGRLWVLDQGDGGGAAGRVFTLDPVRPAEGFGATLIQ